MDIVYDNIIFSLQRFGGISTYWSELIYRLSVDDDFNAKYIGFDHDNVFARSLAFYAKGELVTGKGPILAHRFFEPRLRELTSPFIFHSSYNRISNNPTALNITTVHDLIHHKFYGGLRSFIHNRQKERALIKSKAIISVSQNTKKDLLQIFPYIDPDIVKVVYNGVSNDFYEINDSEYINEVPQQILHQKYLICVSSREAYKNFDFIINLVSDLPDFQLYIVGPEMKKHEILKLDNLLKNRWRSFTSITSRALNELYNNAYALLYPSSYEGFGIPLLEAMRAACPFVALNSSSIPEVAGKSGILIDTLDQNKFINAILSIENDRDSLILKGKQQGEKFSWDSCYRETKEIYQVVLNV